MFFFVEKNQFSENHCKRMINMENVFEIVLTTFLLKMYAARNLEVKLF